MANLSVWHWIVIGLVTALALLVYLSIRNSIRRREDAKRGIGPPLKGVQGWLLFYCVSLTILLPIQAVYGVVNNVVAINELPPGLDRVIAATVFETAVLVAIAGIGLWAGVSLWKVHPDALYRNRLFFRCYFFAFVLLPFATIWMAGFSREVIDVIRADLARTVIGAVVWLLIWTTYFKRSQRVKNTYVDLVSQTSPSPAR